MPEQIGRITIPSPLVSTAAFPFRPDYPCATTIEPPIYSHSFNVLGGFQEQRFVAGTSSRRYQVRKAIMTIAQRNAFVNFWNLNQGAVGQFAFPAPNANGSATSVTCRFADPTTTLPYALGNLASAGFTLIEVPTTSPAYGVAARSTRYPRALSTSLLAPVITPIPLVTIQPYDDTYPAIYISDRRVTVGGQLYQPRLLDWSGISQAIGGSADEAQFTLGNADRVFTRIANQVDLFRANIQFSLFFVENQFLLDLWSGFVGKWRMEPGANFILPARDGIYETSTLYPPRKISRTCNKLHNNADNDCPNSTVGVNSGTPCDKGFDTPAGCMFHGMQDYFGGILVQLQGVKIKDNSTGTWGFGRDTINSVSAVSDSIFDEVLPEIYVDHIADPTDPNDKTRGYPVNAKIAEGRDEGDFYAALGIVSEGPIGAFADVTTQYAPHKLDGESPHGWPKQVGADGGCWGLRRGLGHDPVRKNDPDTASDKFSLSEGGAGPQSYGTAKAAGVAFLEIRRQDTKGLQLSRVQEHSMQAVVRQGVRRWEWSAPGSATLKSGCTNPVWIAVNAYLRGKGLFYAPTATQEKYFDVAGAIAAAATCARTDGLLLIGTDVRPQFQFVGIIQEEKPLRDWITEILNSCLGYWTNDFDKLKIGLRINSSVVNDGAFTEANILFQSLFLEPLEPQFNHLTINYADEKFDYVLVPSVAYDIDYATAIGPPGGSPFFQKGNFNISGCPTQNQAALLAVTRLREELGGINSDQQRVARNASWKSTICSLNIAPGDVVSISHPDMPDYPAQQSTRDPQGFSANYGELRVQSWKLNKDYSIEFTGKTTNNDMYDLEVGPKPADTLPPTLPVEDQYAPANWDFRADKDGGGDLLLDQFQCGTYGDSVHQGTFEIFHVDEATSLVSSINPCTATATTITTTDAPLEPGKHILVEQEIMYVVSVDSSGTTVLRGQLGTTAAAHGSATGTVSAVDADNPCSFGLPSGLPLQAGDELVQLTGGANIAIVATYYADSGITITTRPFSVAVGNTVTSNRRAWKLERKTEIVPFAPRFFRSAARADFVWTVAMPSAAIAAVRGQLENTRGIQSDYVIKTYGDRALSRLRTLGGHTFVLPCTALGTGDNSDCILPVTVPAAQSVEYAYAQITGGSVVPLPTPRAIGTITPSGFGAGATITLSGTVGPDSEIGVSVSGDNAVASATWSAAVSGLTNSSTLAQAAANLAAWLNADAQWSQYFHATSAGAIVSLTDLTGQGGALVVSASGPTAAAGIGFASSMGVLSGRRYRITYFSSTASLESDLSPLSDSTGPTGSSASVTLLGIPVSADPRVDQIHIYATPDGADDPVRYLGFVPNTASSGSLTSYVDSTGETALAAAGTFAGPSQPAQAGTVTVDINVDGQLWAELFFSTESAQSNVIDGACLGPLPAGAQINIDVQNNAGLLDLQVVLQ